jgi:DUF438 domain-containing protein
MCLTCGCLQAHKEMTKADITFEDVKRAADANGATVDEVLTTITKTADKDRADHPAEYTSGTGV